MCALQSSRPPAGWYVGELPSFTGQGLVKVGSAVASGGDGHPVTARNPLDQTWAMLHALLAGS
jgi:hypothetical protein